jgi:hypothetical protein
VSSEILKDMLSLGDHNYQVIEEGIPVDAKIVFARMPVRMDQMVELFIESAEFPECKEGKIVEEIQMRFTTRGDFYERLRIATNHVHTEN